MSFGLGVASSPSWNPDTNFAFLFSALRLVRLARDVNSVEPSPLEWISVGITCQSWYRCSGASSQSEMQTAQYTMQKAKIQFIVIFSAILLRNGGQQSRGKGRGADFEDFEETWKSGCTGTCFLLKGNNLALLCPALGGGHTSCWRNWELDKEFVKKYPRSKFLSQKTRLTTYSNLRQKCVNGLKWD